MALTRNGKTGKSKSKDGKKRGDRKEVSGTTNKNSSDAPPAGLDPKSLKLQQSELENAKLRQEIEQMKQSLGKSTKSQPKPARIPAKVAHSQSKRKDSDDEEDDTSSISTESDHHAQVSFSSSDRKKRKFDEKSANVPVSGDMMKHVEKEVKKHIRKIKFVSNKKETRQLCQKLMKESNVLVKYTTNSRTFDGCLTKFVEDYGAVVTRTINQYRTNAQSDVKKAYVEKFLSLQDGETMPPFEEFFDIVMRNFKRPDNAPDHYMPFSPSDELNAIVQDKQAIIDGLQEPEETATENADDAEEADEDATVLPTQPKKLSKEQKKILRLAKKDLADAMEKIDKEQESHETMRQKRWREEGIHDQSIPEVKEYERKLHWFIWYWECILPAIAKKEGWGHSIRCYGTISQHGPPDDPNAKYITAADEALCLLFYQNGEKRFPYVAQCAKNRQKPDKEHPNYQAKWSSSRSGQLRYGGWKPEGVEHFLLYRKKLAMIRRMESTHRVELDALNNIQAKRRIRTGHLAAEPDEEPREEEALEENLGGFIPMTRRWERRAMTPIVCPNPRKPSMMAKEVVAVGPFSFPLATVDWPFSPSLLVLLPVNLLVLVCDFSYLPQTPL